MILKSLSVNLIESRERTTDGVLESSYSIEASYDPGDGTTIKHRTKDSAHHMRGQTDPIMNIAGYHVWNGRMIAERMYRDRGEKMELQPVPEALKGLIAGNDLYNDPDYTVGPGPTTPHQLLEAGD